MEAPKLQGSKTNKHNFDKYIFHIKKKQRSQITNKRRNKES